jgi:RNA polymerase I-specific transcription-initiation factor
VFFRTLTYCSTRFDIAFRSGEEPTHASRADFLTQSTLNSRRGFRALVQGRVPRETLVGGAAWHFNLEPVLKNFVPDACGNIQLIAQRLCKYDLIVDDYRSGPSLRRELEAREELAVDLALSTDLFSTHSFAKPEPEITDDDKFETMSRAAEAMTLSETVVPSVHFGFLAPIPVATDHGTMDAAETEPGLALPLGVRLLLAEWDTSVHPDQYTYHDPYGDQQPAASTSSPMLHASIRKRGGREQPQTTQPQRPPAVVTTARSREIPISSSQPEPRRLAMGFLDTTEAASPHSEPRAPLLASTQTEPGPFGGRPLTGRKKAVPGKKRMMGF